MTTWDVIHARGIINQSYEYYILDFDRRLRDKNIRVNPREFKFYHYICTLQDRISDDNQRDKFYQSINLPMNTELPKKAQLDHHALRVTLECVRSLKQGLDDGMDLQTLKQDVNAHLGRHGKPKTGQDAINQQNSMYRRRIDDKDVNLVFHQMFKPYLASLPPNALAVAKELNTHFTPTEIVEMLLDYEDPLVSSTKTMQAHFAAARALNGGEDWTKFYSSSKVIERMYEDSKHAPAHVHAAVHQPAALPKPKQTKARRFSKWLHNLNWLHRRKRSAPIRIKGKNPLNANNHSRRTRH